MSKITLLSLSASNFYSFAEKSSFTTETDKSKKDIMDSVFECNDYFINKVSYLYGANGSGKTFFCKIIREIQRLLMFSPITAFSDSQQMISIPHIKELDVPIVPFAFDKSYHTKPSEFSVEIMIDKVLYTYTFSLQDKTVIYESVTKKYRRSEKLLERTSPFFKDISVRSDFKNFESNKFIVKPEALCLPIIAMFNNNIAQDIVTAITNINSVNMTAAKINPKNSKESFSESRLKQYTNILQQADPTLKQISVNYSEEEVARQKFGSDDFENKELISMKTTVAVNTQHKVFDEKGKEITDSSISFFNDESLGTIKLFTALPYLFDTLESGGVLIIDEIENGLHLSLVREIVNLFVNKKTNPNNAQLICTSHQPLLLTDTARRDQVWVVQKNKYGKSSLHRLSDLKTSRAKVNLTEKILEGAFGCNPDIFFNN